MKKIILFLACAIVTHIAFAQTSVSMVSIKVPALDKSPMDMAYFPSNFPVLKIQDKATSPLIARVIYSRPQKSGRIVFGELVEIGKVWRLGANEATEIEFFRDVKIANKRIAKGKYTMYAVVNNADWTVILNKETDVWGAFKYDEKKDVLRTTVPVQKLAESTEMFTMFFEKAPKGMDLIMVWDDVKVVLPVSLY
jgi:hypothetical protein